MPFLSGFDEPEDLKHKEFYMPYEKIGSVELNPQIWDVKSYSAGAKLFIELFDDKSYLTTIDRVNRNVNGTLSIRSRFDDYPMGYIILNKTDGYVTASIRLPEKNERYSINTDAESGLTYLKRLDVPKIDFIESGPPLVADKYPQLDKKQLERLKEAAEKNYRDTANVDVMIVYTPTAEGWANANQGSINNTIAMAMEKAQLALENSETKMNVTLVHSNLVNYTESGNSVTDLQGLTYGHGPFGEVHQWREIYGADLVALFAHVSDVGGIAWLLTNKFGSPSWGFSLTRVQQAGTSYTHVHEMGHNMGCHHHKEQNTQPGPTNWSNWPENIWSAGWRWLGMNNQMFCTVMTYTSGEYFPDSLDATRVPYLSNPDIEFLEGMTGHPADGDNARTLREIRHVIAAYKQPTLFTLTLEADPPEGGIVEGGGEHGAGQMVAVSCTVNEEFFFINWTDEDGNVVSEDESFEYQMPPEDITLTANFSGVPVYDLVIVPNPEEGGTVEGEGEYYMDEEVEIFAEANKGWEFIDWAGDIEYADDPGSAVTTVTMPAEDISLTAVFDQLPKYDLTLKANPEEGGIVEGYGSYEEGEEVIIKATPVDIDWEFKNWTGNTEYVDDPDIATATVIMPAKDIALTANFLALYVEEKIIDEVKIFPNPAHNKFTVEANDIIEQVRLIDIRGQVIRERAVNAMHVEIYVKDLHTGLYFMQVYTSNSVMTKRVKIVR